MKTKFFILPGFLIFLALNACVYEKYNPGADLSVSKTSSSDEPIVGASVSFTITATNYGPGAATSVKVVDIIPTGYTLISATPTKGTWASPTWTIGNMEVNASASITVIATVNATGVYANTATISCAETDPIPANNNSTSTPGPVVKVTYNKDVKPIFVANCSPCHLAGGINPNRWDVYASAKNKITVILDRVNRAQGSNGFMPQGGTKLPPSTIEILNKWVSDGTLEN